MGASGSPQTVAIAARERGAVFHLESKVESALTEAQIKKYRKKGAEYLVAVTKHPPEVSERRLRQLGAFALRWQDVHRGLLEKPASGHIDRFIQSSFVTFLEELGMAHADDVRTSDLQKLNWSSGETPCHKMGLLHPKTNLSSGRCFG